MTVQAGDRVVKTSEKIDESIPVGMEGTVVGASQVLVQVRWDSDPRLTLGYNGDQYPNTRLYWKNSFEPIENVEEVWKELELC